jgi:hypothetical protein
LFSPGYDGRFCFYKIPDFTGDIDIDSYNLLTVKCYGELPYEGGRSYWAATCMHGEEGEKKCVGITTGSSCKIMLIDMVNCAILKMITVTTAYQTIDDVAISLDNSLIICGGQYKTNIISVQINSFTREAIKCHETPHSKAPFWGQIANDGKHFMTSSTDESIIWDINTMKPVFQKGFRLIGLYSHNRTL